MKVTDKPRMFRNPKDVNDTPRRVAKQSTGLRVIGQIMNKPIIPEDRPLECGDRMPGIDTKRVEHRLAVGMKSCLYSNKHVGRQILGIHVGGSTPLGGLGRIHAPVGREEELFCLIRPHQRERIRPAVKKVRTP